VVLGNTSRRPGAKTSNPVFGLVVTALLRLYQSTPQTSLSLHFNPSSRHCNHPGAPNSNDESYSLSGRDHLTSPHLCSPCCLRCDDLCVTTTWSIQLEALSFLEITVDLVIIQIQAGRIAPEGIPAALRATYQWLLSLQENAANGDAILALVQLQQ
jgi:hypothetical protein